MLCSNVIVISKEKGRRDVLTVIQVAGVMLDFVMSRGWG